MILLFKWLPQAGKYHSRACLCSPIKLPCVSESGFAFAICMVECIARCTATSDKIASSSGSNDLNRHLRNSLCPWVNAVLKVRNSHFANIWRPETLPNQTGMFHNSQEKGFISVFYFILYGDKYILHNSPVMTLIVYPLQTWLKRFTEILILDGVFV